MLYLFIYNCCTGYPRPFLFPQENHQLFQMYLLFPWKVVCPQKGSLFSTISTRVSQQEQSKSMNFDYSFFEFSKYHWDLYVINIFAMTSTCCTSCDPTRLTKTTLIPLLHIFQSIFNDFMLASFDFYFAKLEKLQQTFPNMKRLRWLMSTKCHCA